MWINEFISERTSGVGTAVTGEIRAAENGNAAVSATRDYSSLPLIAPSGIAYVPVSGTSTMVIEGAGGAACLGVMMEPTDELEPGELMLYSAGGARIVLKNDGKVYINGREVG